MNSNSNKKVIFVVISIILMVLLLAVLLNQPKGPAKMDYGTLLNEIASDNIQAILFVDDYNVHILKKDSKISLDVFKKGKQADAICTTSRTAFVEWIQSNYTDKPAPFLQLNDPQKGSFWSNIIPIVSLIVIIGLGVMMFVSMRGKGGNSAMSFAKTKAKVSTNVTVKFSDVAGAEEEKDELKEIVEFLKSPKKFQAVGARIPKGVLLVGPPGTGKTLFAKAVAGEANVPFFSLSGSDFVEMFVGVGASRVRDLFSQAKKNMPCIIFIDEIDAVGRKRGAGMGGGNDEREQTLNQLLVQMDGFEANDGIVIMAATNRADVLDPALMRPGRFDRQIYVHVPDVKGREAIFKVHSRNKPISPDIDFKNLARITTGFSGADIENLLNESAILAARDNRNVILMKDLLEGINKVVAGPQKKSRVVSESDRRITAYHEAGHAIVGRLMKNCDPVQEVSIIPRGMAAGYTLSRPDNDNNHVTKNRLNDEIAMMLGGRASEQIVIQDISTGASQDIKRATSMARSMVTEWGMSDTLPNIFYGGEDEVFIGRDFQTQQTYSDRVAGIIDEEIKKIIDTNYRRAFDGLKENINILHNMVKLLFERDTIYGDEVDLIMQGKSVEEVSDYINKKQAEQERIAKVAAEKAKADELAKAALKAASLIVPEKPTSTDPTVIIIPGVGEVKIENPTAVNTEDKPNSEKLDKAEIEQPKQPSDDSEKKNEDKQ